jgi:hypothetical protein
MYDNKMVAFLKANGKVLREFKDKVYVPYGTEYQICLKNLNTLRAIVGITIDGKEVATGLVINAGEEMNLERSLANGNLKEGLRFKFIERTGKIEEHRGVEAEDGLVRVSFRYEQKFQNSYPGPVWANPGHWEWQPGTGYPYYPPGIRGPWYIGGPLMGNASTSAVGTSYSTNDSAPVPSKGILRSAPTMGGSLSAQGSTQSINTVMSSSATIGSATPPANEVGITVEGSKSDQKFQTVSSFATQQEEHVIVLHLLGETELGKEIVEPVTVKVKAECPNCGTKNKATSKFCSDCGTGLELI